MLSAESEKVVCPHCGGNSPRLIRWKADFVPIIDPATGQLDRRPKFVEHRYRCESCLREFTVPEPVAN